jgi:hypothetical protein
MLIFLVSTSVLANPQNSEKPINDAEDNPTFLQKVRSHTEYMFMELFPSYMPSRETAKELKNYADTGGKTVKAVNAYDKQGFAKSLLGPSSTFLNPVNYLKFEVGDYIQCGFRFKRNGISIMVWERLSKPFRDEIHSTGTLIAVSTFVLQV